MTTVNQRLFFSQEKFNSVYCQINIFESKRIVKIKQKGRTKESTVILELDALLKIVESLKSMEI